MNRDYWLQRWQEGRTGWHHDTVMPLLEQHWPAHGIPRGARVLVPLCGKSLDMAWFAAQGLHVLGVELSPIAIAQFFSSRGLSPETHKDADGLHHVAGNIEIIEGDIFGIRAEAVASCSAIYDRAALIALPAPLRERYARQIYAHLPAGSRGLLITLDYPQRQMDGPPFSVDESEVHHLFATEWTIELAERRDILATQPSFSAQGVTALHTAVYRLHRRPV